MKFLLYLCAAILLSFWIAGCSSSNEPAQKVDTKKDTIPTYELRIIAHHLRPLRNPEGYVLWLKYDGDDNWYRVKERSYYFRPDDSTSVLYDTTYASRSNELSEALVSIEKDTAQITTPSLQLWHGFFSGDSALKTASLDPSPLGNFAALDGSLVFTTQSADTTAFVKEFYLAKSDSSKYSTSLQSLPVPASGWKYAIWAVDSNFTPPQYIYYGQFVLPTGHDSDSSKDALAFPGGFNNAPMNIGSGSIIVTLEPDWYGNAVRFKGPSPFSLLVFDRTRFLLRNHNYPMTNVSDITVPGGYILMKRTKK